MDYPKIFRIPYGRRIGKRYLTPEEVEALLSDTIVVEEKLDGKTIPYEHGQVVVFGEFLKWVHSTYYDQLPGWVIAFDVWDVEDKAFLSYDRKLKLMASLGYTPAPLVYRGICRNIDELVAMIGKSAYSEELMEGIVVKNYDKQLFGKLVRAEFTAAIQSHWLKKPKRMNRLQVSQTLQNHAKRA